MPWLVYFYIWVAGFLLSGLAFGYNGPNFDSAPVTTKLFALVFSVLWFIYWPFALSVSVGQVYERIKND